MHSFDSLISRLIKWGPLTVVNASGAVRVYGDPTTAVKPVTIRIIGADTQRRIVRNPALGFGEAYMDERLSIDSGDIRDFLDLVGFNTRWEKENPVRVTLWRPQRIAALIDTWNWKRRAKRNVAHHYDLSDHLYPVFLGRDLQYSCAYFTTPNNSLESAQADKKAHICAKLDLKAGQRVLDIGCGWGGTALYMSRVADVEVLGITLSAEQLKVARDRAEEEGLSDRVRFELLDYREVQGRFDRIVSVGMFEHVGPPFYRTFFNHCRELLTPNGLMLLHTIGREDGPGATDKWLAKYIFPGGYVPALSQLAPAIEKSWLWLTDLEVLRHHYAWTLNHWYDRTTASANEIIALYGERFFRMWQFYLAGGISAFKHDGHVVFQFQLARSRDVVPPTRDYIAAAEADLRQRFGKMS